ncbi:hypothetical protein [Paenarthrobacter sp. NPDC058040]|uniref:hypothetical protein n=1 Tax=unclassified Paenarthrobacter TaxID=2634190 RepID=UPI0036DD7BD1
MKKGVRSGLATFALLSLFLGTGQAAYAADDPDTTELIKKLSTPKSATSASFLGSPNLKKGTTFSTASLGYTRATLYSGDWPLFTEENVDFYYDWSRVTASYGYQRVGAFGFNTVQALGINRSYDSVWQHSYRALTDAGVGTPTPWGNANIYHATVVQGANVYGDGYWYAWQE